jgi:hypothetical protein
MTNEFLLFYLSYSDPIVDPGGKGLDIPLILKDKG